MPDRCVESVLVFGGAGFVGSAVVRTSVSHGFPAVSFDNFRYGFPANLSGLESSVRPVDCAAGTSSTSAATTPLRRLTGWTPPFGIRQGLEMTVEWFSRSGALWPCEQDRETGMSAARAAGCGEPGDPRHVGAGDESGAGLGHRLFLP